MNAITVRIRIVAYCGLHPCQFTRKLKRAATLEFFTESGIIFIHCWAFVLYFFDTLFITNFENVNNKYINVEKDTIVIYHINPLSNVLNVMQ